jgi:hypothetical protein
LASLHRSAPRVVVYRPYCLLYLKLPWMSHLSWMGCIGVCTLLTCGLKYL